MTRDKKQKESTVRYPLFFPSTSTHMHTHGRGQGPGDDVAPDPAQQGHKPKTQRQHEDKKAHLLEEVEVDTVSLFLTD